MSVTVVVPTANRPDFLAVALRSIAQQTVAEKIERVIVSENAGCADSERVCRMFPSLPIDYRINQPPIAAVLHLNRLIDEASTEFVALLCDDDWWSPWHLQSALQELEVKPHPAGFCSACIYYDDEKGLSGKPYKHPALFLLKPEADPVATIRFSSEEILTLCWLYTPFHMSTLVAKTTALQASTPKTRTAHPYYADRILFPYLSLSGDIVYQSFVTVAIRNHPGNDVKRYLGEEVQRAVREGSEIIRQLGSQGGIDAPQRWKHILSQSGTADRDALYGLLGVFLRSEELSAEWSYTPGAHGRWMRRLARYRELGWKKSVTSIAQRLLAGIRSPR